MLYKMHLNRDELTVIDDAIQEHITLMDVETPTEAAESAAKKIKLLREYVDLNTKVWDVIRSRDDAKKAYEAYTFKDISTKRDPKPIS